MARRYLLQIFGRDYFSVEDAAYFNQSASPAFGWRGAYAIRALPDLRDGIVLERLVRSTDILLRLSSSPGTPGAFLCSLCSASTEPGGKPCRLLKC
jgi:hypothetical protein